MKEETKKELIKIVLNSRTTEENFGIGVKETMARTQVLVDILNWCILLENKE